MTIHSLSKFSTVLITGLLINFGLKTLAGFSHPYHVSVTEIVQNVETGAIEITIKTIPDDMIQVLENRYKGTLFIGEDREKPESDSILADYLSENFILMVNDRSVAPIFLGKESDLDALWCYMEIPEQPEIKSLALTCTLLLENNPTHTNIVHFFIGANKRTAYLNRETKSCEFKF